MIALTRARRRRTIARIRGQRKCTEPVASSSDLPTDHRRSDNHSESHQPQTLRTRCIGDSMDRMATGQAPVRRNSAQIADKLRAALQDFSRRGDEGRSSCDRRRLLPRDPCFRKECRSANRGNKKCTEPVAPSSDFPTDHRRSDCLPESHQPWAFRTRCKPHTRGLGRTRQGGRMATSRKLRSFLFAQGQLALRSM